MEKIRNLYTEYGVSGFYEKYGESYSNPHQSIINELLGKLNRDNILDLCCGSGEVSLNFKDKQVIGLDPYTYKLYEERTHRACLRYDFKDIAQGALEGYHFDTIICSFALHLCEKSLLPMVLYNLSEVSDELIILTPNKKPEIKDFWDLESEEILDRVRMRVYKRKTC